MATHVLTLPNRRALLARIITAVPAILTVAPSVSAMAGAGEVNAIASVETTAKKRRSPNISHEAKCEQHELRRRINARCDELGLGKSSRLKMRRALLVYLGVCAFGKIKKGKAVQARAFIDNWPTSNRLIQASAAAELDKLAAVCS